MPNLGGWELIVLLGVLLLVFGAKKLPDMARSVGQSARVFKGEMKGLKADGKPADAPSTTELPVVAPAATTVLPVVDAAPVDATR
jgi:sec-independent protein translocase protein TatA